MTTLTPLCKANLELTAEVRDFLIHVPSANEESITDFLIWRWRAIDKRFNFLRVSPFNRMDENLVSGADFDMELWIVGNSSHIALTVQAKKFVAPHNKYRTQLMYPKKSRAQLNTLLKYAGANSKEPFYFIYSVPELSSQTMCPIGDQAYSGIFMVHASEINKMLSTVKPNSISRDNILQKSNPFHCMFCCPLSRRNPENYFQQYFPGVNRAFSENTELPSYVRRLLEPNTLANSDEIKLTNEELDKLKRYRSVAVYNMRAEA
jgi:hypothetical protein